MYDYKDYSRVRTMVWVSLGRGFLCSRLPEWELVYIPHVTILSSNQLMFTDMIYTLRPQSHIHRAPYDFLNLRQIPTISENWGHRTDLRRLRVVVTYPAGPVRCP